MSRKLVQGPAPKEAASPQPETTSPIPCRLDPGRKLQARLYRPSRELQQLSPAPLVPASRERPALGGNGAWVESVLEADAGPRDPLIAEGFEDIRRYLRKRDTGTRQELAMDYAHTFLAAGNYESLAATPYESVFTSETGLLMQDARDEVYKMYCAEHVQPSESLHTPEDHVTFEFEFVATLLERTNDALHAGNVEEALHYARTAQEFNEKHQLNWIDDLCDAVMNCAQTRFYRGLSKVTRGWVHLEAAVMADEVAALKELRG